MRAWALIVPLLLIGSGTAFAAEKELTVPTADGPLRATVMAAQGVGGAVSPALGGWIAQAAGYPVALAALGAFPLISLALWIGFARTLQAGAACVSPARTILATVEDRG